MARSRRAGSASAAIRRSSSARMPTREDEAMRFRKSRGSLRIECRPSPGYHLTGQRRNLRRDVGWRMDRVLVESKTAPLARASTRPAPELTIVVPTFNERTNVPLLVARLQRRLDGVDWEVIFVAEPSARAGTAAGVGPRGGRDARARCIRRIGRRGLAGACLEGMLASQARFVAVMDANLQHDEALLTDMLARLRPGDVDLAVASRYVEAGSAAGLTGRRARYSRWSSEGARRRLRVRLSGP